MLHISLVVRVLCEFHHFITVFNLINTCFFSLLIVLGPWIFTHSNFQSNLIDINIQQLAQIDINVIATVIILHGNILVGLIASGALLLRVDSESAAVATEFILEGYNHLSVFFILG